MSSSPAAASLWPAAPIPVGANHDSDPAARLIPLLESLVVAFTVEEAVDALLREGTAVLGSWKGRVLLFADDARAELEVVRATALPRELAERRAGADIHAPAHDAVLHRVIIAPEHEDEWRREYANLAELAAPHGIRALAAVPFEHDGRVLGALEIALPAARPLTGSERDLLAAIGRYGAGALERARRAEAERQARILAESANRVKADFLAVVSHELRTPLNAIGGYTELLQMGLRGPLTPAQEEDLRRIEQGQRHLLSLVNAILNFAKLDAGRVSFTLSDVPAAEVLGDIEPLVQPQARSKGVRIQRDQCDSDILVLADREKLQQILLNLLTNAIKFTPSGGQVTLRCVGGRRHASFQVIDTGEGIAPDKMQRIFEPFVQLNRPASGPNDGVGLGLAISRELARGMHGTLKATSTPGQGSTFTLTLPLARGESDDADPSS